MATLPTAIAVNQLFRFPSAVKRDPGIDTWMKQHPGQLGAIAQHWWDIMRERGDDVRELLHDGHPTACVADAAFATSTRLLAMSTIGFFRGAELPDPAQLLQGTGKLMRHVKLRPESDVDATALAKLVDVAYTDMKRRLEGRIGRAGH